MENPSLILIVDDDPRGIAALEGLLRPEGYRLESASSGIEALAKAVRLLPDLMLLDVMMPEMDGFDVCRRVRATPELAELPVVFVTALDDDDAMIQGFDAGADDVVSKPFNRTAMRTRLRTLTRVNRYRRLVQQREKVRAMSEGVVALLTDLLTVADPQSFHRTHRTKARVAALATELEIADQAPCELAALFGRVGTITRACDPRERTAAAGSPASAARLTELSCGLLDHIPGLTEIADIVRWQDARFDGGDDAQAELRGAALPLGARLLKVANDAIELELGGRTPLEAWQKLAERPGWYDPQVLTAAEFVARREQSASLSVDERHVRQVRIAELQPGWRLHQDLITQDGTLLLGRGHVLTVGVIASIANFVSLFQIAEPIAVRVEDEGQS